MKYSVKIALIIPLFFCYSCGLSEEGCQLYMQRACAEYKGIIVKKGVERYETLRFQTDKGKVKLPGPDESLWNYAEVGDSIYKLRNSNRCRIVKPNKSSLEVNYVNENSYQANVDHCGNCTSKPAYQTNNPDPYRVLKRNEDLILLSPSWVCPE